MPFVWGAPRPHFPIMPVRYPSACKRVAMVVVPAGSGLCPSRVESAIMAR
jgi:hypothetical protein